MMECHTAVKKNGVPQCNGMHKSRSSTELSKRHQRPTKNNMLLHAPFTVHMCELEEAKLAPRNEVRSSGRGLLIGKRHVSLLEHWKRPRPQSRRCSYKLTGM